MGLDMFLFKRPAGTTFKPDVSETHGSELCYWRKANQIRHWFVKNTGYDPEWDCREHYVTKGQLQKLRDDCDTVLRDHSKAMELLPTMDGFFFGASDYNEFYYNEIKRTLTELDVILRETDFSKDEIIYYEWW